MYEQSFSALAPVVRVLFRFWYRNETEVISMPNESTQ